MNNVNIEIARCSEINTGRQKKVQARLKVVK